MWSAYEMLKSDETWVKVEEWPGSNEPDVLQWSGVEAHNLESAALHHKSLLPVSRTRSSGCPGVPRVTLQK